MLFNVVIYVVFFRREAPRRQLVSLGVLSILIAAAWIFGTLQTDGVGAGAADGIAQVRDGAGRHSAIDQVGPEFSGIELRRLHSADRTSGATRGGSDRMAGSGGGLFLSADQAVSGGLCGGRSVSAATAASGGGYQRADFVWGAGAGPGGRALRLLQSRVHGLGQGDRGGVVRQDPVGAVWRIRAAAEPARGVCRSGGGGIWRYVSGRAADDFRSEGRASGRADLLREHLPEPLADGGEGRRRHFGQHHERCVVRRELGAISTARDGGDAHDQDQGAAGASGEYGNQRGDRADRENHGAHATVQARHGDRARRMAAAADGVHDGGRSVRGNLLRAARAGADCGVHAAASRGAGRERRTDIDADIAQRARLRLEGAGQRSRRDGLRDSDRSVRIEGHSRSACRGIAAIAAPARIVNRPAKIVKGKFSNAQRHPSTSDRPRSPDRNPAEASLTSPS